MSKLLVHHQPERQYHPSVQEAFEDFLELEYVPAISKGVSPGSLLPAEKIMIAPEPVDLAQYDSQDTLHGMSITVHKDSYGIIRSITVHCSCGCSASLAIEYDDGELSPSTQPAQTNLSAEGTTP